MNINEDSAQGISSVYCAIRLISGSIASLPIHLYRPASNGRRVKVDSHPSEFVLQKKFNQEIPAYIGREFMAASLLAWGNAYAEIARSTSRRRMELWPILPGNVDVTRDRVTGQKTYKINRPDMAPRTVELGVSDILHIPGPDFDGLKGISVVSRARKSLGLTAATEAFGSNFFSNGTHPGVVAKHPGRLSQEAHNSLRSDLSDKYSGLGNSHRLLLLEEGMSLDKIGIPPEDSQFLETRQFQVLEVARWFGLPPHKLKELSRATHTNIEFQNIEYVQDALLTWLIRMEQVYAMALLSEQEQADGFYFKHNLDGLLRADIKTRYEAYAIGRQWGWLSADDIRALEDMPPIPGGDVYLVPLNMVPSDMLDDVLSTQQAQSRPEPTNQEIDPDSDNDQEQQTRALRIDQRSIEARDAIVESGRHGFRQAIGSIVTKEADTVEKILAEYGVSVQKRALENETVVDAIQEALEDFYRDEFKSILTETLTPSVSSIIRGIAEEAVKDAGIDSVPPDIEQFITDYLEGFAGRYADSSIGQLLFLIRESEDVEGDISSRLNHWRYDRSESVTRDETTQLANGAYQTVAFAASLSIVWRIRGASTCPYCRALNGKKISKGQYYLLGGTQWEPDGATSGPMKIRSRKGHPPLHQGCDCYISIG